jgi:predicted ABC-type ATPase
LSEPDVTAAPVLVLLAGPNGSGKSTFFTEYITGLGLPFVNADRVAAALRVADPTARTDEVDLRAFSVAEAFRGAFVEARLSFCTESVFSDPVGAKLKFLARARERGYDVILIFIGLESPELSRARVMQRVAHGGHDVPDAKLAARFPRVLANLRRAVSLAQEAFLFDNSSYDEPYRLVALYVEGQLAGQHPPLPSWTRGLPGLGQP